MPQPLYPVHVFYHLDKTRDTLASEQQLADSTEEHDSRDAQYTREEEFFDARMRPLRLLIDLVHALKLVDLESEEPSPRALAMLEEYRLLIPDDPPKDPKSAAFGCVGAALLVFCMTVTIVVLNNVIPKTIQAQIGAWGLLMLIVAVVTMVCRSNRS